jgi:hypothetical protein
MHRQPTLLSVWGEPELGEVNIHREIAFGEFHSDVDL